MWGTKNKRLVIGDIVSYVNQKLSHGKKMRTVNVGLAM